MKQRLALLLAPLFLVFGFAGRAAARVERFAVIVGNNHGHADEARLRYAESDARRVYDVLRELGGFAPVNMVLLAGAEASEVQRTLITVNDRIRAALSLPNTEVVLFVYYSGHADADALHLGPTQLGLDELARLVRGSAATMRLLVLDACQSGIVTRRKGGHVTPAFAIPEETSLSGEGLALLTASAAHEDAQESDELKGSFFTHALVTGLLGAADQDRDGDVLLEEAYRYAYDGTLRSTSRTASGTQHPSFSYDLRGQGRLVLTRPGLSDPRRGTLELPSGASYLVFRDDERGAVVAEIGQNDAVRALSLPSGRYFLRGRTTQHLLEGTTLLSAGAHERVNSAALSRIEYAHLVRKGGTDARAAQSIEAGGRARTTLPNAETPCFGGFAGYRIDTSRIALSARAGGCVSQLDNHVLEARVAEYDLGLRAAYVWDLTDRFALELGTGAGSAYFVQHFDTRGRAPPRRSLAGDFEGFVAASVEVGAGLYLVLDIAAQTYVLRVLDERDRRESMRAAFTSRAGLGVGKHF